LCLGGRRALATISPLSGCAKLERLKLNSGYGLIDEVESLDVPRRILELEYGGYLTKEHLLRLAATSTLKALRFHDFHYDVTPQTLAEFRRLQPQCDLSQIGLPTRRGLRFRP